MRTRVLLLLLLVLSTGLSLTAQVANLEGVRQSPEELDKLITGKMQSSDIPGLSVVIINDGKIVFNKTYGVRNVESNEPVDTNTTFEAASLTKPVFAYGFAKLVASGKVSLDTPLYRYLDYSDINYDERHKLVTARMVLSHTAGFPNWRNSSKEGKLYFVSDPGEKFVYSGEGYVYLGKVVEKVSGTPLNDYFRDSVFVPLSMSHSFFIWTKHADSVTSIGHSKKGKLMPKTKNSIVRIASGLQTNAIDYARLIQALLTADGQLRSTLDVFFTPQLEVNDRSIEADAWGLGFALKTYGEKQVVNHFGSNPGFESFMEFFPGTKFGVVMFANKDGGLEFIKKFTKNVLHAK
jgi:CubicO group peptidase (beta-lactamase class C family)